MPYQEKIAWLTLFAITVTFGPYFAMVAISPPPDTVPNLAQLAIYAKAALAQVVILGIGHLILRRSSPEDARQPLDERDRHIESKAYKIAYYVLIAGFIWVGGIMPFTEHGWRIVNSALFMITLAGVLQQSVIVYCYRRQS